MRFLLDDKYYVDDQLLDKGQYVGDAVEGQPAPAHSWRFGRAIKNKGITAGQVMPLSKVLIPMDDEAKKLFKDTYGEEPPDRDPFGAIPLQGNVTTQPPPGPSHQRPEPPPTSTPRGRAG